MNSTCPDIPKYAAQRCASDLRHEDAVRLVDVVDSSAI